MLSLTSVLIAVRSSIADASPSPSSRATKISKLPAPSRPLDANVQSTIAETCRRYLKGVAVKVEVVDDIPLTRAGKRQVVVVES